MRVGRVCFRFWEGKESQNQKFLFFFTSHWAIIDIKAPWTHQSLVMELILWGQAWSLVLNVYCSRDLFRRLWKKLSSGVSSKSQITWGGTGHRFVLKLKAKGVGLSFPFMNGHCCFIPPEWQTETHTSPELMFLSNGILFLFFKHSCMLSIFRFVLFPASYSLHSTMISKSITASIIIIIMTLHLFIFFLLCVFALLTGWKNNLSTCHYDR